MKGMFDHAYQIASGIRWLVEARGVKIIDEYSRRSVALDYPRSAIWELLMRGHSETKSVSMAARIAVWSEMQAAREVRHALDEWMAEGWIESRTSKQEG